MSTCPYCGSEAELPDVHIDLYQSVIWLFGNRVKCEPREAKTFSAIWEKHPEPATFEYLTIKLWGDRIDGPPLFANNSISQIVATLRSKVAEWVRIRNQYTMGYTLEFTDAK